MGLPTLEQMSLGALGCCGVGADFDLDQPLVLKSNFPGLELGRTDDDSPTSTNVPGGGNTTAAMATAFDVSKWALLGVAVLAAFFLIKGSR